MNKPKQTAEKELFRGKRDRTRPVVALLVAVAILFVGVFGFLVVKFDIFDLFDSSAGGQPATEDIGGGESLPSGFETESRKEGVYSFLVVGLDNPNNSRNTDVLMLCTFNTESGDVNILQIPRDSYIEDAELMPQGGKINNYYNRSTVKHQSANPSASADEIHALAMKDLCNKISTMFCVPIQHYISFNTVLYRQMLEIVCPITVDVPFNMDYDDPTQDLHIHLKKGRQELNPEQAEGFSRFRQNNRGQSLAEGDFSRVDLQKMVLAAIADKVFTTITPPQATAFAGTIMNSLMTDMSVDDAVWFLKKALSLYAEGTMSLSSIRMYDLPCRVPSIQECMNILGVDYAVSYGFMEKNQGYTLEILNKAFNLSKEKAITAEMLGYEEQTDMSYCDHSDTAGKSLQEIMDNPPKLSLF